MSCTRVFDVADRWPTPALLLAFVLIGGATMVWRALFGPPFWRNPSAHPWLRNLVAALFLGTGLTIAVTFAVVALSRYLTAKRAAAEGQLLRVEGPVEDFQDEVGRWRPEQFRVGKVTFRYSISAYSAGFHQTRKHGGPIAPGLYVRIGYALIAGAPIILTLDVCR